VSSQDRRTAASEARFADHAADKTRGIGIKIHSDSWACGWENTKASEKTNDLEPAKERLIELTRAAPPHSVFGWRKKKTVNMASCKSSVAVVLIDDRNKRGS
jgi:hypothetical protein